MLHIEEINEDVVEEEELNIPSTSCDPEFEVKKVEPHKLIQ